jgi:hypothetical protein
MRMAIKIFCGGCWAQGCERFAAFKYHVISNVFPSGGCGNGREQHASGKPLLSSNWRHVLLLRAAEGCMVRTTQSFRRPIPSREENGPVSTDFWLVCIWWLINRCSIGWIDWVVICMTLRKGNFCGGFGRSTSRPCLLIAGPALHPACYSRRRNKLHNQFLSEGYRLLFFITRAQLNSAPFKITL